MHCGDIGDLCAFLGAWNNAVGPCALWRPVCVFCGLEGRSWRSHFRGLEECCGGFILILAVQEELHRSNVSAPCRPPICFAKVVNAHPGHVGPALLGSLHKRRPPAKRSKRCLFTTPV